jgi:signal transduction histidine kinase
LPSYTKLWTAAVAACLATLILAALLLPQSFLLTALSDVVQSLLLLSGAAAFILHAARSRGRLRLFWTLMAFGASLWFAYQMCWNYYEVWLRAEVPDLFSGDIILFLHIVPPMAAVALRPHAPPDEYAARLRRLDFALLSVWWVYLYVFAVIPWQYVIKNPAAYDRNLNSLYLVEKLALLAALFVAWMESKGGWRTFYASLFGATITYSASSYVANWALSRQSYYSGSLYDIPLAVSMAWITVIGLWTRARDILPGIRSTSTSHGVWLARMGMMATFSLSLFAAWALVNGPVPPQIRSFRLVLTLSAVLVMGAMVFVRQRHLDQELLRLLTHSRDSIANLKCLQTQITESEKLASIGQLVGGAAHELNNPITAMLGYSDILRTTTLNPEQTELAEKIGQHVRRARSLVASLLGFAKQGPAAMLPVDLNALVRTAVKLSQPQWQALKIEMCTELPHDPLLVRGDANQLLQVCGQIINDALHALEQSGTRTLTITAKHSDGSAILDVSDTTLPHRPAEGRATAPAHAPSPENFSSLGLNACQSILRQHRGRILWQQDPISGLSVRVEIPLLTAAHLNSLDEVPAMLQPQPSA